jgi:hypothetical protein
LIATGERSGLQTHTATTGSVSFAHADEKLTVFLEPEPAIRADGKFDLELGLRFNVGYSNRAADPRPYDY